MSERWTADSVPAEAWERMRANRNQVMAERDRYREALEKIARDSATPLWIALLAEIALEHPS